MNKKAITFIFFFFFCFGFFLLGRLIFLQIADHQSMAALSDAQQVKKIEMTETPRGSVVDRNGIAITNDTESPALLVFPTLVEDVDDTAEALAKIVDVNESTLKRKIAGKNQEGEIVRYTPFWVKSNLSQEEISAVKKRNAKGVFVLGQKTRYYEDMPMVHLLGQLATVSEEDRVSKKVDDTYDVGDIIGVSGLESVYEDVLRGYGGTGFGIVVDEKNRVVDENEYYVYEKEEKNGGSVSLTIDLTLQRVVEAAFGTAEGACVILDAKNGDVLAMGSFPKFDPTHMQTAENGSEVNKALKPYPPASLFKIFDAAMVLENHQIQKEMPFFCDGSVTLNNGRVVNCWKKEGHGAMIFADALAYSCNPVFVKVGEILGAKNMVKGFHRWELDDDTLLGYPLKNSSALDLGGKTEGKIANAVLGEDGVMMTPLNLAKMVNVIASKGYVMTPRLVTDVKNEKGEVMKSFPSSLKKRVLSSATAETVTEMMRRTFLTGTGASLKLKSMDIAGKTGSSETGNVWIGGIFPAKAPRYTIVILVENGSSGVGSAGPILKKICGYLQSLE